MAGMSNSQQTLTGIRSRRGSRAGRSSAQQRATGAPVTPPPDFDPDEGLIALQQADATAAPPEVETVGAIGPDVSRFARESHTHSGVNLGDAQTLTSAKTFDLDPAAPFVVTAGSAVVPNLDADLVDGIQGAELLQRNGSVALTANWDAGSFEIRAETLESDVATGTAPLTIASTTMVANLNADLVDGQNRVLTINADHTHQSTGAQGGQLDHGLALTGLSDDDHGLYLKEKASGGLSTEVPDHLHTAAQAGQLDWDDVWSDAVHTHRTAAEGGTLIHGLALTGLSADDHTQYLLVSGTRPMTGALDMGGQNIDNIGGNNIEVRSGTAAPSGGAGVAATIGSLYGRDNGGVGELWVKTGAADTAWTQVTIP